MRKIFLLLLVMIYYAVFAQNKPDGPAIQDYKRAVSFLWSNMVNKKVFNINIQPVWFQDSTGFCYITQDKNGKVYNSFLFKNGKAETLFDHARMAKVLTDSLKFPVAEKDLPLTSLVCKNSNILECTIRGSRYHLNLTNYSLEKKANAITATGLEAISPDGKWIAYTENYNLYIKSASTGIVRQLSTSGYRLYEYGTSYGWSDIIDHENGERPKRIWINWSPDSKWIQTYITDMRQAKKMYLLDWSIDSLYKPKLLAYYRGSPGDTDMVKMTPVFYNIESGAEYIKSHLVSTHTNPVSYEWSRESGIAYQENAIRGYQSFEIHRCNMNQKTEDLLLQETSTTNIDNFESRLIERWGKYIITSEKSGWRQLYTLDIKSKAMIPLTSGNYYVNDILQIDTAQQIIYFTASGKDLTRNPYHQYLYKINITDLKTILLTPEDANHDVSMSPDGNYFIDNMSTLNKATSTRLRSTASLTTITEISKANIEALDSIHYTSPESIKVIGRDGLSVLYGALWKPTNFDATKKYPIIDQSYTGPHTYMYPRNFIGALARSNQALAELGFIVLTVDGMGTANRSKAFHNVSYKNMGKNLEDHKLAILQLGRKYSWIDTNQVGIFGHSAGGYDAGHAVLEYPDFYKVAVASSADHDFRMEKDWWPEMYMGWPVDSSYHRVSNITMAGNLKGKLLITHGGIDENVNPSATFKLAEALIRANKEFDMLILPSQRHGYQGLYNEYFTKKKWNYFVEHLLGAKPIWDVEMK